MKKILGAVSVVILSAGVFCSLQASRSATTGHPSVVRVADDTTKIDWEKMSKHERGRYMGKVITPAMEAAFVKYDSAEYKGTFSCYTCHGKVGVDSKSFKMPNASLPKLSKDPVKFRKMMAENPKATEFMMKVVKPQMAHMLGKPEFDMATKTGFGCGDCHTSE